MQEVTLVKISVKYEVKYINNTRRSAPDFD